MRESKEQLIHLLRRIEDTVARIIENSRKITSYHYYASGPSGMERLESTCMLLIAVGEGLKGVDKLSDKSLFPRYPEIDWKGAMGIRDIIAHHYFDLDAEIVFNVVKQDLLPMLSVIRQMIKDLS